MAKISLSKPTELNFQVNVEGALEVPTVRFLMNFSENYTVMIPGTVANRIATIKVPRMPFLEGTGITSVPAKVELIVDGRYFLTWSDNIEITKDLKVETVMIDEENKTLSEDSEVLMTLISNSETIEEEKELEIKPEIVKKEEVVKKEVVKKEMKIDSISLEDFLNSSFTSTDLFGEK